MFSYLYFQVAIAQQESVINELEVTLLDTLRTEGTNIITGTWTVNEVSSSLVEVEDAGSIKESKMVGKTLSGKLLLMRSFD